MSQPVAFRHMHSLSIFSIADYCVYAFMFGGIEEWIPNASASDQAILSDTTVLEICTIIISFFYLPPQFF